MPTLAVFYGIVVTMYADDHRFPHFHVRYPEYRASYALQPRAIIAGELPSRAARLVEEWASLHEKELEDNWQRVRSSRPIQRIPPLI
ncbi:MAG: transcriptional regulator [Anaerolinea sp.]|nr:transcriptional regulator [Anaerolinea sp.]